MKTDSFMPHSNSPSSDPTGYPKVMHHKHGLATRQVGSKAEKKALGADWSDRPFPKRGPVEVKESHHDLVGAKPKDEHKPDEGGFVNMTHLDHLVASGVPREIAEQMARDHLAAMAELAKPVENHAEQFVDHHDLETAEEPKAEDHKE